MEYTTVSELHQEKRYSIKALCASLKVSRSGYYKWLKAGPSKAEEIRQAQAAIIKEGFYQSDKTFGAIRIKCAIRREHQIDINIKTVRRLMKIMGLVSDIRRKRPIWQRSRSLFTAGNIISREFNADKPNQKWFTDISYLSYGDTGERAYISAIIDSFDKRIVAYQISKHNDNKLVMNTIRLAFKRFPDVKPIIHSDRGFQYTSTEYKRLIEHYGINVSMSRAGHCLDNQPIESFWGILKSEYFYRHTFNSLSDLKDGIYAYIDYYMNKRYMPIYNGLTPIEVYKKAV
ncbi:IS3 family transposase [Latilactobacillus sp. 5-91]|uniref:IS3 family transposase n=1 Tax=Latilactobacillus sp. 5-91 TaxID=3410924 RepID=UPI003C7800DD